MYLDWCNRPAIFDKVVFSYLRYTDKYYGQLLTTYKCMIYTVIHPEIKLGTNILIYILTEYKTKDTLWYQNIPKIEKKYSPNIIIVIE